MITEYEYSQKVGFEHRKKFAQFFTPKCIADFMAKWVVETQNDASTILDPAFGLGVFSNSLYDINQNIKIVGYDVDDKILQVAQSNFSLSKLISIYKQDYLTASWEDKFDGIICNPPYLKFHDYDNSLYIPYVNAHLNTNLNKFTNLYALFLLKSIYQLKKGGRLAYIIPTEFLNSDYGVEVKRILLKSNMLKHVIVINFQEQPFDDALTTASILLCENNQITEKVKFYTTNDFSKINIHTNEYKAFIPTELDAQIKWKQYYGEINATKYINLVPFNTFAKVSRGIATGANKYFIFNNSKLKEFNLNNTQIIPCICHSKDIDTNIFTYDDFKKLACSDKDVYLFNGCKNEDDEFVRKYIEFGEYQKINKRYLTANRKPWYSLENKKTAPIWVSVFNRKGLRFIRNEANVSNLTTFHSIHNISKIETDVLFAYLLTNVAHEILFDNSRQYGNGLIKFEPNDLNKGKIVDLALLTTKEISYIKRLYNFIKISKDNGKELIELLNSFFTKKYTGTCYDIEQLLTDLNVLEKYNVRPNYK